MGIKLNRWAKEKITQIWWNDIKCFCNSKYYHQIILNAIQNYLKVKANEAIEGMQEMQEMHEMHIHVCMHKLFLYINIVCHTVLCLWNQGFKNRI